MEHRESFLFNPSQWLLHFPHLIWVAVLADSCQQLGKEHRRGWKVLPVEDKSPT